MRRFLVIYALYAEQRTSHVAEGLILYGGGVYAHGFYPSEGEVFYSMADLRASLRNNDDIARFDIHIVDKEEK